MRQRQGLGKWVSIGVLALLVSAAAGYFAMRGRGEARSPEGPRSAPAFELKDRAGRARPLTEWKGQVVLVHFWAKWCPPCLPEIPRFLKLAEAYAGRPLVLALVSLDPSWTEASQALPAALPDSVVPLLDPEGKVPDLFGTYQYPETYLISRDQRVLAKWVGPQDWNTPAIRELIESALSR